MVGILKRSRDEMEAGSKGTLQNPEHREVESPRKKQMLDLPNGASSDQSSGVHASVQGANGVSEEHALQDFASWLGGSAGTIPDVTRPELPVDVAASWLPFRDTVARTAQEVYNNMIEALDMLSSGKDPDPSGRDPQYKRKKLLYDFAQQNRTKLVKLLLVSRWARDSEACKQMFKMLVYLEHVGWNIHDASAKIGMLKQVDTGLPFHTTPPPDFDFAMEVLSKHRADWISDIGYLDKPPLTNKEMLEALRNINALLTLRLTLHEQLPEPLKNYRIADGRVVFQVGDEFELALSLGSENAEQQLYYVDFRFSFCVGGNSLVDHRLPVEFERYVNPVLARDGLRGCYDFLHEFTLTHKLTILRLQAQELARGRWGDDISVESFRRHLVVQYWTNKPGKMSWIEVGVRKMRPETEALQSSSSEEPYLFVRWFRQGVEVHDHGLDIDIGDLSFETILKDTIAAHTNYIMASTKDGLRKKGSRLHRGNFRSKHHRSPVEPSECALDVAFPDGTEITLNQEPVSGRFWILPISNVHSRFEMELNRSPEPHKVMAQQLKELRAATAKETYQCVVDIEGWPKLETQGLTREFVTKFTGPDIYRYQLYRPVDFWHETLSLCLSHHTSGKDVWRLVEMFSQKELEHQKSLTHALLSDSINPIKRTFRIPAAQRALLDTASGATVSHNSLRSILAQGTALASRLADIRFVCGAESAGKHNALQFSAQPLTRNVLNLCQQAIRDGTTSSFDPVSAPKLYLNLHSSKAAVLTRMYEPNALSIVDGVHQKSGLILTNTLARLSQSLPIAEKSLYFDRGSIHISRGDSRTLAVRLHTPVGLSSVATMIDRLSGFAQIARSVDVLRQLGLAVETFDLTQITANLRPRLSNSISSRTVTWEDAQFRVYFKCAEAGPTGVRFDNSGPLFKLQPYLNDYFASSVRKFTFDDLAQELCAVAPTLFTLSEQERQLPIAFHYIVRSSREIRVMWSAAHSISAGYMITAEVSGGSKCWRVAFLTPGTTKSDLIIKFEDAWKQLCQTRGAGYAGLGSELKIDFSNASSALWHIFDAFAPIVKESFEKHPAKANGQSDLKSKSSNSSSSNSTGASSSAANAKPNVNTKRPSIAGSDKAKDRPRKASATVTTRRDEEQKRPERQVITLD